MPLIIVYVGNNDGDAMSLHERCVSALRRIERGALAPVDALLVSARCAYDTQWEASDVVYGQPLRGCILLIDIRARVPRPFVLEPVAVLTMAL